MTQPTDIPRALALRENLWVLDGCCCIGRAYVATALGVAA